MLYISELFASIQGEGIRIGVPSIFCRFQGCSFGCPHCDTKYTWRFEDIRNGKLGCGPPYTPEELARHLKELAEKNSCFDVVLTGGEPTEQPEEELVELIQKLRVNTHVTLETAGFVTPIPKSLLQSVDLLSLSPKLSCFYIEATSPPPVKTYTNTIRSYISHFAMGVRRPLQVKFVISNESELSEIPPLLDQLDSLEFVRIILQPNGYNGNKACGTDVMLFRLEEIVSDLQKKPNPLTPLQERDATIHVLPQLHRLIWGTKRGV